jgi:AcrR family transcriptional regulator
VSVMQSKTARKVSRPTALQTRHRLLDAAERIVAREGMRALTFDSLAIEADAAKGTVLYHFDSKDELSAALIERFVSRFDVAWSDVIATDDDKVGRNTRAYIAATHGIEPLTGKHFDSVNGAVTAALAHSPRHLEPVRRQGKRHQVAIEDDGLDPVQATIVRLAVDGLWFTESLGLMCYDRKLKKAVLDRLHSWTKTGDNNAKPKMPRRKKT